MLNLSVDVGLDVKTVKVPFTFTRDNLCTACGARDQMVIVDIFGREAKGLDLHPMDYIKCKNCGFCYSIRWDPTDDGKMRPVAINRSIKKDFDNLLNYKSIKDNGTHDVNKL